MPWRRLTVLLAFSCFVIVLAGRALDMQVLHSTFFEQQGEARQLRHVTIPANRGDIVDRNGEPLAISTPVNSIWLDPQEFSAEAESLKQLARLLSIDVSRLKKKISAYQGREFMYLKRHVSPELASKVLQLNINHYIFKIIFEIRNGFFIGLPFCRRGGIYQQFLGVFNFRFDDLLFTEQDIVFVTGKTDLMTAQKVNEVSGPGAFGYFK